MRKATLVLWAVLAFVSFLATWLPKYLASRMIPKPLTPCLGLPQCKCGCLGGKPCQCGYKP
jgi:hypothetical protein